MGKGKVEKPEFKVRCEYVPSKDAGDRLLRAFRMIFFKNGKLAPEFEELLRDSSDKQKMADKVQVKAGGGDRNAVNI